MCSLTWLGAAITGPVDSSLAGATTATLTIPITNNAATNPIGILCLGAHDSTDGDRVITSVKWGGTNMVEVEWVDNLGDNKSGSIYYLVSPPSGSSSVVIVYAGTVSGTAGIVTTWEGVDQVTPLNTFTAKTNATATVVSVTTTSSVDNVLFIDQYTKYLTTGTVTPAGDQTVLLNLTVGAAYWQANTYNNAGLAAGAKTFTYTNSLTSGSINVLAAFAPFVEAGETPSEPQRSSDLRLLGVGR